MPRNNCPICDANGAKSFLLRESVPVHQNMLFPTAEAARAIPRGTLDMRVCRQCGFVFNAAFDPTLVDYGPAYENSQEHSPAFNSHLDQLVERLVTTDGVRNGCVVEVGCGKGAFLGKLLAHPGNHSRAVGFDPSYLGDEIVGRARFIKEFYSPATAVPADVVLCRHVIEHIPEPLDLLRTVRAGVGVSGETRVYFETPCVEWILSNQVPWDFFYEHCSLFTKGSLALALERSGFSATQVGHVFGDQYLWAQGKSPGSSRVSTGTDGAPLSMLKAAAFASSEAHRLSGWRALLEQLTPGPVYAWGAGAKGVTFCNLVDPEADRLAGVVDVNPAKQGRYLPGTGHAIVSPEEAVRRGHVTAFLVFNPNYVGEVQSRAKSLGSSAPVLDLMMERNQCVS